MNATTPPTSGNLARYLAHSLGGYDHARGWHVGATVDGAALDVTVTDSNADKVTFRVAVDEGPIVPDMWAVVSPDDETTPRSLIFTQGTRTVEIQLSDYLAASLGLATRDTRQQADEPLLDPDCRDGKCGSCVGGPCEHHCHTGGA